VQVRSLQAIPMWCIVSLRSAAVRQSRTVNHLDMRSPPDDETLSPVITGSHAIMYAEDPASCSILLRDVLPLPIRRCPTVLAHFQASAAELGVHPAEILVTQARGPRRDTHELYLMATTLETDGGRSHGNRSVEFVGPIENQASGDLLGCGSPGAERLACTKPRQQDRL